MGVTDDADDGNGAAYAVRHKCDSPRAHDAVLLRLHLVLHLWGVLRLQSARSQLGDLLRVWFVLRRPLSPGAERQRIRVLQVPLSWREHTDSAMHLWATPRDRSDSCLRWPRERSQKLARTASRHLDYSNTCFA